MPEAFRSFRQALVADAVLRRTRFMSGLLPKQRIRLRPTSRHVLGSNTRDERTPLRTHLGLKASSPTAPTRGREFTREGERWGLITHGSRARISHDRYRVGAFLLFRKKPDLKDKPDFAGQL